MSAQRFSTGQEFLWNGQVYRVRRLLPDSKLQLLDLKTNQEKTVAFIELLKAILAGKLHFVVNGQPYTPRYIDINDCPEHLRVIVDYRLSVIKQFVDMPPYGRKKAIEQWVEQQPGGDKPLSTASIYRWMGDYINSGQDWRALVKDTGKQGGKGQARLKKELNVIIDTTINDLFYVREKRTIDYIRNEIGLRVQEENQHRGPAEQLPPPSRATVGRRLNALDTEGVLIAKRGKRAARRELTPYRETEYPTIPLARVEIDHTRTDIVVIDENDNLPLGRLTLTYCLDTAFRYPLGYYLGFEPASYLTVMECLYHSIRPKENVRKTYGTEQDWIAYGIPFELNVDNGKEFIGRDLDDACQSLGITLNRLPVKTPYFKAAVERMFGTLNTGLLHGLPGTTFSSVHQKGDYNSLKQACISLSELDKMIHIFLLDIYAESFHQGLEGIPARRWEDSLQHGFFPRVPSSLEELRILLGRVAYRTIQPGGIRLFSLRYQSSELVPLRTRLKKQQAKIKYNPADISRIHVYDPDENDYLEVPALAQNYTQGLSLWKHEVIRNFVLSEQDKVDIAALGRAQRKIQEIVERSLRQKSTRTRSTIARWQGSGKPPTAEPPPPAPAPAAPDFDLDMNELAKKGWGIG